MAALVAAPVALAGLLWAAPGPSPATWLAIRELAHEVATWTVAGVGLGALGLLLWSVLPRRRSAAPALPAPRHGMSRHRPRAQTPTTGVTATAPAHRAPDRAAGGGRGVIEAISRSRAAPAEPPAPGHGRPAADRPAASSSSRAAAPATPLPPGPGEPAPAAARGWQLALNSRAGRLAGDAEDLQASCSDLSALAESTLRTVDRLQSRVEALGRAAKHPGAGSPGNPAQAAVEAAVGELVQETARVRRMTSSQAAYGRHGAQASESLARQAKGLRADLERLTEPR